MSDAPIQLLVLEDNPGDARLIKEQLAVFPAASFEITFAARLDEALRHLGERHFDVVLTDLHLLDSQGLATVNAVRRRSNGAAVLVLSGSGDDPLAAQAVREGAQDYMVKGEVTPKGLGRALCHAIERKKLELRLREVVTGLEQRVRERTAALEQYNARLAAEVGERRAAEARARQIGSLYAILGEVNEAIAQAADERELFRRACRAIGAQEGYVAAGFGIVDAARGAIASGLVVEGFEEIARSLPVSLDPSRPEGRGLIATAAREGRALYSGDYLREAAGGPWEALARQYRVRSVAALPIKRGGRVAAVFAILSSRPDFFGPDERTLAGRLAANLSFALDHFDQRAERDRAQEQVLRQLVQLENAMLGTVRAVSAIVEQRDPYTSGHQRRVGDLAAAIGAEMGLAAEHCRGLRIIGTVHDVGKLAVPAEILAKPGRLSAAEFDLIKGHAQTGYEILQGIEFPWPVAETVRQHHERHDGSGYAQGLKGNAILLEARILGVADVVESIASHRPYRPTLGIDAALREIETNAGVRYCPEAVAACLRLFRERGYRLAD